MCGCTPAQFNLAPGAADVRVTNSVADVNGCAPVGNIELPKDGKGLLDDPNHALGQLKNQVVGLGGNAAFVSEGTLAIPQAGVAYRCSR
jgi:hypothetical protein